MDVKDAQDRALLVALMQKQTVSAGHAAAVRRAGECTPVGLSGSPAVMGPKPVRPLTLRPALSRGLPFAEQLCVLGLPLLRSPRNS